MTYSDPKSSKNVGGEHLSNNRLQLSDSEIQKISNLKSLISSQESGNMSPQHLAQQIDIEPCRLEMGCKFLFNKTPIDLINDLKLDKIATELVNQTIPLSEIVYRNGYLCRSYFYEIFMEKFKCDPKDYIRQFQSHPAI